MKACQKASQQISWSQTGPGTNGTNGTKTSVVSASPRRRNGGANCADGGSKFTAAQRLRHLRLQRREGRQGRAGGSSLAALDGSPCTTATGEASTVLVTVTHSGTVDISCIARVNVSASFSGGTMGRITIQDGTLAELGRSCRDASECSATLLLGHHVGVSFHAVDRNFEYTCPGESPKLAGFIPTGHHTAYFGECSPPFGGRLEGDYIVTGSFLDS